MNNIEILEERINFCKNNTECREELNQCFGCTFEIEEIQAIENLIYDYKKLKKQMGKDLDVVYIKGVYDERDKWKSKVKEKIEELEKRKQDLLQLPDDCARTLGLEDCDEKIILYKELLEEGE